mgnify:CR=1 FL=1
MRSERPGGAPYFRAAVASYPGCIDSPARTGGYAGRAPLLLLVAGPDDRTRRNLSPISRGPG